MGSSRPGLKYNSRTQRWEVIGKGGQVISSFADSSLTKVTQLEVGATGDKVTKIYGFVATLVANTTVGSGLTMTVGTLQSVTGSGVGCSEIAIGDIVLGTPKINLTTVQPLGFYVPTTSTLQVYLTTRDQSQGSLAAGTAFQIVSFRTA